MRMRTAITTLAILAAGALGGWLTARGSLDVPKTELSAEPRAVASAAAECRADGACCDQGLKRGLLLAQADTSEQRVTPPLHFVAQAKAKTNQATGKAPSSGSKPNILVIWGDDIGTTNVSAYSDGLMGYTTPNIDRIADEWSRHQ